MSNPKHDRQGVRRASDIEQKYNLSLLNEVGKGNFSQSADLSELQQLLSQFSVQVNARIQRLERLYSVGSIYTTLSEDSPSDIFGGEWELIAEGNILVGTVSESELPELFQGNDKCFIWKRIA
jgi:hypothetical protein